MEKKIGISDYSAVARRSKESGSPETGDMDVFPLMHSLNRVDFRVVFQVSTLDVIMRTVNEEDDKGRKNC